MSNQNSHRRGHPNNRLLVVLLAMIYLMIVLGPFAAHVTHSKRPSSVMQRECSGDCDLCGCSPESRANHTCCCAKKRQQQARVHEDDGEETGDCCKKKPVKKDTILACGCPCGNGKQLHFFVAGVSEVLPSHFTEQFNRHQTKTQFPLLSKRLASRHGEPPDPPPKLV